MAAFFYYLVTFCESIVAIFGIRPFEQPRYTVVAELPRGVEIRDYAPRMAVETDGAARDGAAFERLFRYITGHNKASAMIAMTTPVATSGAKIAMTVPVQQNPSGTMRFFLPGSVAKAGPPIPDDPQVKIVTIPGETVAALRFSGSLSPESIAKQEQILDDVLRQNGRKTEGASYVLGYDPPFTIPFLRRNEVAVVLGPA